MSQKINLNFIITRRDHVMLYLEYTVLYTVHFNYLKTYFKTNYIYILLYLYKYANPRPWTEKKRKRKETVKRCQNLSALLSPLPDD